MNELQRTIDSREVAKMVDREHKNVIKDIRRMIEQLGELKSEPSYFIEATYINEQNKEQPCYELTKKGCELYSTRMTGAKGTQFAVTYIERFNQMEEQIKSKQLDTSNLSPELQMFNGLFQSLAKQELATKQLETKVDNISEIVALNTADWRKESRELINKMAQAVGGFGAYSEVQTAIYQELEQRAGANLKQRLTNKRRRMADEGVCLSKRKKLNNVDVIADDKKLIEIYVAIVKEFALKYGIWEEENATVSSV